MRYAFFPGCSLESTAWDFDRSTRAVCGALGIDLVDIPDWVCCGSTPAHTHNAQLAVALPALNLKKAQTMNAPVVAACASCYSRLRFANYALKNSADEREKTARITGESYDGSVEVIHLLDLLTNRIDREQINQRIKKPLSGLRVASYYGCLLSRPAEVSGFESPDHPCSMDDLMSIAGATPVDWPYKTECCGASLSLTDSAVTSRLGYKLLKMAREAGADCICVACPLCQLNLDLRQSDALATGEPMAELPVLYVTQLLGLALGISSEDLGIDALSVNPDIVLNRREITTSAGEQGAP